MTRSAGLISIALWSSMLPVIMADDAAADHSWQSRPIDRASVAEGIVPEERSQPPATSTPLPDGLVGIADEHGDIVMAWYGEPTGRYGHAVLGDAIEGGSLIAITSDGRRLTHQLPMTEVFEDRYPRLADLDGDGRIEIVTIRSSLAAGASVTIYGVVGDEIIELASSGIIGHPNRWLNIAGIAPFAGGPGREIAFVRTPHIGGTLFFFRFDKGRFDPIGTLAGFSNHVIGSRELRLSAVADIDGDGTPELALPSARRNALRIVGLDSDGATDIAAVVLPARIDKAVGVTGEGIETRFIVGLEDGSVHEVHR